MKIALINPSIRPNAKRRQLPVGLGYIALALEKACIEFELIDMDIDHLSIEDLESILVRKDFDIYALGCIVSGFKYAREIAELIKKINPKAWIIAGNSLASSIPELLLRNTEFNIAVIGEADVTIIELISAIEKKAPLREVPGIAFIDNDIFYQTKKRHPIKNLDTIGFPNWHIFNLQKYNTYGKINANVFRNDQILAYPLNSARGCPFNCTFCYHVFKQDGYRKYSIEAIREEIIRLHTEFSASFISLWDELSFYDIESVENHLEMIKSLDFDIAWAAVSRGNLFKKCNIDLLKELSSQGLDNIAYSLENADKNILKSINKKISVNEFIEQSKTIWDSGITPLSSVIFGYPQETPETIQRTLDVCYECNIYPSVGFLLPLPGTQIYNWALKNGKISDEVEYLMKIGDRQDFHINLTSMDDDMFVDNVTSRLRHHAKRLGLEFDNPLKTVTYQKPKKYNYTDS